MQEKDFVAYLKKKGKSGKTIERYLDSVKKYLEFLQVKCGERSIEESCEEDLRRFAEHLVHSEPKRAYTVLWGVDTLYRFIRKEQMHMLADSLKWEVHHKPLKLKEIVGVDSEHAARLEGLGVVDVKDILREGRTYDARVSLAQRAEVPLGSVLSLVKMAELSRIAGVGAQRTRLYHDAGYDTLKKLARADSEDMRAYLTDWVKETGFEGAPPTRPEASHTVKMAGFLESRIEFKRGVSDSNWFEFTAI